MSCLFNSLAAFTPGQQPQEIRQKICDYLSGNPSLIDGLHAADVIMIESGQTLDVYVQQMRSAATWGGAIEIRAYCNIYQANVRVLVAATGQWIEFIADSTTAHPLAKLRWTGGHYDPLL